MSILGRPFIAAVTQSFTYLRRESHLILLPLACALQATTARLRATLSALDTFPTLAVAGVETTPKTIAVVILLWALSIVELSHLLVIALSAT